MSQGFSVVGPHSKCRAKCRAGKCLSLNLLGFSDLFARLWADVLYPFQKFRVEVMNRFMFTEFLGHPDRRSRWRPKPHLRTWRQWQQSICQAMSGWMGCQLDQFWSLSLHHSTNLKQFKPIYVYIYTNLNHPIFKGVDREGRIDFFKAEESRPSPPCGDSGYPMIAGALTSSGNHGARTRRSETSPGGGANDKAPSHHLAGSRGQKEIIPASKLLEVE